MYACTKCDAQSAKWSGRCTECGGWGTLADEGEMPLKAKTAAKAKARGAAPKPSPLTEAAKTDLTRIKTGSEEIDRVLGGGIVPGSLVLLSGEPGIGKSTIVAMMANAIPSVLYVSGEESASQLAGRFQRLGISGEKVQHLEPYPAEDVIRTAEHLAPKLVVIDSIQTLPVDAVEGIAGSPNAVRAATSMLMEYAKRTHVPVIVIGQVTKDGSVAGPKTLEHLVDVVLALEGDPLHAWRILRATKNRFGSTDETGVFEMSGSGLVAVEQPSARFLAERVTVPGSVIASSVEGSRVFLVEVQALVEKTSFGTPTRRASGFDQNRLQMLCAILSKRTKLSLSDKDVYVNVVGGLELKEPGTDLAVCAAILSAARDTALPPTLFVGEVGLGGEVRSAPFLERRKAEAERMGIKNVETWKDVKTVGDLS